MVECTHPEQLNLPNHTTERTTKDKNDSHTQIYIFHTHIYIYGYTCTYIFMRTHTDIYVCIYIYTHIYANDRQHTTHNPPILVCIIFGYQVRVVVWLNAVIGGHDETARRKGDPQKVHENWGG